MLTCWQTLMSSAPRVVVQTFLLVAFFHFFGFPAITRFAKKGVMVVESSKDTKGVSFPAITIAVVGQIENSTCFLRNTSIEDCIVENTLKRSDILPRNAFLGYTLRQEIELTEELVREDFTSTWAGIYFTLRLPFKVGLDYHDDQFFLPLSTNLTYTVFVHDPDYFLYNMNPIALPAQMVKFTTKKESWFYRMEVTEVNSLDLPSKPCVQDPDYNFQSCLRRSISAQVLSYQVKNILKTKKQGIQSIVGKNV